ncbi:hypothetical protein BJX68DRAFT_119083 [Aspergillus pseudodeflectus]|uniref:Uncharacterized protein n=1 Tax=Aspergillus pseudodeflectus TaxID=176178 RepID=A0ABR4L5B6_9EURO
MCSAVRWKNNHLQDGPSSTRHIQSSSPEIEFERQRRRRATPQPKQMCRMTQYGVTRAFISCWSITPPDDLGPVPASTTLVWWKSDMSPWLCCFFLYLCDHSAGFLDNMSVRGF